MPTEDEVWQKFQVFLERLDYFPYETANRQAAVLAATGLPEDEVWEIYLSFLYRLRHFPRETASSMAVTLTLGCAPGAGPIGPQGVPGPPGPKGDRSDPILLDRPLPEG